MGSHKFGSIGGDALVETIYIHGHSGNGNGGLVVFPTAYVQFDTQLNWDGGVVRPLWCSNNPTTFTTDWADIMPFTIASNINKTVIDCVVHMNYWFPANQFQGVIHITIDWVNNIVSGHWQANAITNDGQNAGGTVRGTTTDVTITSGNLIGGDGGWIPGSMIISGRDIIRLPLITWPNSQKQLYAQWQIKNYA